MATPYPENQGTQQGENQLNNSLLDGAEEDHEEGMDRMMNEGGGVVEQNFPAGAPILRNDLVNTQE